MLIGFHTSIAGGIPLSVERAARLGCTTMQIFSHSPRAWELKEIPKEDARAFRATRKKAGIAPVFVHTSYLINLASRDESLYERSIAALRDEMLRAELLGAEYVVTHLGSASGHDEAESRSRVAYALSKALDGLNMKTRLLLENTAGERGDVGHELGDIGDIIDMSGIDGLGVAIDTCHSFGAGYDIKSAKGLDGFVCEIDEAFGLKRLRLIHLNDSKHPLGSKRDRHENIGKGEIGRAAMGRIINHPKLRDLPFVMETPKAHEDDDKMNMALVKKLRKKT
jgi:deoxyribonuclease IV